VRARVVTVEELDENTTLSAGQLKNFTSGGIDSLPVRGCGEAKTRSVQVFFKLIVVSNHKARFGKNVGPASIGRALIYAYQTQFDPQSEPSKEAVKLLQSTEFLDEIFSWLVEGSMEWYRLGSTPPCNICMEETEKYKHEESPLDAFLDHCTETPTADMSEATRQGFYVTKTQLREKCKAWYQDQVKKGVYEPRDFPKLQELKTLMEARNYKERQIVEAGKARGFVGLRLKASVPIVDEAPEAAPGPQ
jgi:phage/plasmid-associated DNA primase